MNQETNFQTQYENGRKTAVTMAGFVYTGGVIAATTIFLFFVLTAFPDTAYFIRALMVLAGLLVGASALAFPVALHNWAVSGNHRLITTGFYYGEICLIVLNTLVSFSTLLFKYAGNGIPAWVQWYEPFTILSLGYVVFAWGTIFITDPQAKAKAREKAVHDDFIIRVAQDMENWTQSIQGKEAIQNAALKKINDSFSVKSGAPTDWIQQDARPWNCSYCNSENIPSVNFCGKCGAPKNGQIITPPSAPAPTYSPAPAPKRLPREYTTQDLCNLWGMTREQIAGIFASYDSVNHAYHYGKARWNSFPDDLSIDNFERIYNDLLSGVKIPGPIPAPIQPNGNGNKSFS